MVECFKANDGNAALVQDVCCPLASSLSLSFRGSETRTQPPIKGLLPTGL